MQRSSLKSVREVKLILIWTAIVVSIVASTSKSARDRLTNDNQFSGLCIGGRPRVLFAPGATQPGGLGSPGQR